MNASEEAIEPIGQFYDVCFKCAADMNAEAAKFVRHRLEEDLQVTHELAQCKGPLDVYNMQIGFCTRMIDDYLDETQKILSIMQSISMNGGEANSVFRPTSKTASFNGK